MEMPLRCFSWQRTISHESLRTLIDRVPIRMGVEASESTVACRWGDKEGGKGEASAEGWGLLARDVRCCIRLRKGSRLLLGGRQTALINRRGKTYIGSDSREKCEKKKKLI